MVKFTATYKTWRIDIEDSGTALVYDNGTLCGNATKALSQIAAEVGFDMPDNWTTRQKGRKLVDFLNSQGPKPEEKPAAEVKPTPKPEPKPELKPEDVEGTAAEIANAKVRVYGKAQNRTVLGIVHAYMVMYPHAKLEDLRKAFPNSLNPTSGVDELFVVATKPAAKGEWRGYFDLPEELLTMGDGTKVQLACMWTKQTFEKVVFHAKQYGIIVADFEKAAGGAKKGGFRLEYLNGYVPPVPEEKKSKWWLWLILVLLLAGVAAFFAFQKPKTVEKVVEVVVHDTVYIQQLQEIEKDFNAAKFVQGKADLTDDAKFVLHDLAKLLEKNPQLKLQIVGHTSAEGDPAFNQKLSEARAQKAVEFLLGRGIAAERLEAIGKGASEPLDANNLEVNRRTEFIVVE